MADFLINGKPPLPVPTHRLCGISSAYLAWTLDKLLQQNNIQNTDIPGPFKRWTWQYGACICAFLDYKPVRSQFFHTPDFTWESSSYTFSHFSVYIESRCSRRSHPLQLSEKNIILVHRVNNFRPGMPFLSRRSSCTLTTDASKAVLGAHIVEYQVWTKSLAKNLINILQL